MFYIRKQLEVPIAFQEAVKGLRAYNELNGENRRIVTDLLLKEQGGLCPLCERNKEKFAPTIEHFLPLSIFKNLGLDYHNLYVSCKACNEPKANHLIPAYIFDPRFNPFDLGNMASKSLKVSYFLEDGRVFVRIPLAFSTKDKYVTSDHYSAYLMQTTLDITRQNRYNNDDKSNNENSSLYIQRAATWQITYKGIKNLPNEELTEKYINLKNRTEYPEFVSLIAFLYHREFRHRNLQIPN